MAVTPGTIDFIRDTLYRIGAMNPEGFYSQDQLNNNMSGNDANAIYYATHDQRYNPNDPFEQERNAYRVENGYKPYYGQQEANPQWGMNAYVTGAGASFAPYADESLEVGQGSHAGIPRTLFEDAIRKQLYPRDQAYADAINSIANAQATAQYIPFQMREKLWGLHEGG